MPVYFTFDSISLIFLNLIWTKLLLDKLCWSYADLSYLDNFLKINKFWVFGLKKHFLLSLTDL